MEIRKIVKNGNEYEFINETWETYQAWGHKTTLFINGRNYAINKIRYYNRTWECYQYQTCMCGCLYQLIEDMENNFIDEFKTKNNIKRLTSEKKEIAMNELAENEKYKELKAVYGELRNRLS